MVIDQDKQRNILEEYADSLMTGARSRGERVLSGNAKQSSSLFYNSKKDNLMNKSVMKNMFNTNNLVTNDNSLERERRSQSNLQVDGYATGNSFQHVAFKNRKLS